MTDYDTTHFYAMILAGGGGTRLWPLSRKDRPKQMLPLLDHRSMFQMAIDRLEPFLPPERIFVVTGPDYVETMQRSVPHLPRENFIVEPFGRNSGPGAGLGMLHIRQRDPQALALLADAPLGRDPHAVEAHGRGGRPHQSHLALGRVGGEALRVGGHEEAGDAALLL